MASVVINLPPLPVQLLPSVSAFAALRALPSAGLLSGQDYAVDGSDSFGDGGGGLFVWAPASLLDDDDATVIKPSDLTSLQAGRWLLAGRKFFMDAIDEIEIDVAEQIAEAVAALNTALRNYPSMSAMMAATVVTAGVNGYLAEEGRAGNFQAVVKASYTDEIAADPFKAYFIPITGAPTLVWKRQWSGRAWFEWGGAIANNSTDNGDIINSMLVNPYWASFQLGEGIYFSSKQLGFEGGDHRISIVGFGPERSSISVNGNHNGLRFGFSDVVKHNELADFSIQNLNPSPSAGAAVSMTKAYSNNIRNVTSIGFYDHWNGVQCSLGTYQQFDGFSFVRNGQRYTGGNSFNENWYTCVMGGEPATAEGFYLYDMCDKFGFHDCTWSSCLSAGRTDATVYSTGQRPEFLRFNNCDWDSCTNGPTFNYAYDVAIDQGFLSNRPGYGLAWGRTKVCEKLRINQSTFYFNGTNAIIIGPRAIDVVIGADNIYASNGSAAPNTYDTILVETGVAQAGIQILGGNFRDDPDIAATSRYRIHFQNGVAPGYVVGPCTGTPGATGFLFDETKDPDRVIANQPMFRTYADGSFTIASGGSNATIHAGMGEQPTAAQITITPASALASIGELAVVSGAVTDGFIAATSVNVAGDRGYNYTIRIAAGG